MVNSSIDWVWTTHDFLAHDVENSHSSVDQDLCLADRA